MARYRRLHRLMIGRTFPCRPGLPPAWAAVVVAAMTLAACGGNRQPEIELVTEGADNLLFERGQEALAEEDWSRAREYFVQIRDNYPQSALRAASRIGIIDTFEGEANVTAYVAAMNELREFLRLYPPTHELAPLAQYKLGMVYFNQMRRPERDQSETRSAIEEFEAFVDQYADVAEAQLLDEVRARLREARDRLSDSSFYVGRFYYRLEYYAGAIDRFREILARDPGYARRDLVYYHLADSLAETDRGPEALPLFERLVAEFPQTEFLEAATQRIAELKISMDLDR